MPTMNPQTNACLRWFQTIIYSPDRFFAPILCTFCIAGMLLAGCSQTTSRESPETVDRERTEPSHSALATGVKETPADVQSAAAFPGPALQIGDAAPPLNVEWLSNSRQSKSPGVQIIVFWATWCPKATAFLSQSSELDRTAKSDCQFIAVSEEPHEEMRRFLESSPFHESIMIAADPSGITSRQYLDAAEYFSLPAAFIVSPDGVVQWIGAADEALSPLAAVLAGTWDVAAARQAADADLRRRAAVSHARPRILNSTVLGQSGEAEKHAARLVEEFPDVVDFQFLRLYHLMVSGQSAEASHTARGILEANSNSPEVLKQLAWILVTNSDSADTDPETTAEAARKALALSQPPTADLLEVLARVEWQRQNRDEALRLVEQAIRLAPLASVLYQSLAEFETQHGSAVR